MFKQAGRIIRRVAMGIGIAALVYLGIVAVLTMRDKGPGGPRLPVSQIGGQRPAAGYFRSPAGPPDQIAGGDCTVGNSQISAAANARSMASLAIAPFGTAETGWQVYEALIAREIGTGCAGNSGAFAARLAAWQAAHGLGGSGQIDAATLNNLALTWLKRRPFIAAMRLGCPPSPQPSQLSVAGAAEAFGGKTVLARPGALAAYRRMVAAARQDGIGASPQLTIASAWRGPDEELARCADGNCGTAAKARCSAHRTGLAFDLVLSNAAGNDGFSTAPANRLVLSRTPAYRWLVAHADRFGFVNYPFEPWHWEWTGESI